MQHSIPRKTIIFLHGKEATPETSASAKAIKEHFTAYNVLVPDYLPMERTYDEVESFLTTYIENVIKDGNLIHLVGISLGGYWAYTMGCKIPHVQQCVLLNPAFHCYPDKPVAPPKPDLHITIVVNLDDEIVDPNEAIDRFKGCADIKIFETGGHRFSNCKDMVGAVDTALNS